MGRVERILVTDTATDGSHLVGHNKAFDQVLVKSRDGLMGRMTTVKYVRSDKFCLVSAWNVAGSRDAGEASELGPLWCFSRPHRPIPSAPLSPALCHPCITAAQFGEEVDLQDADVAREAAAAATGGSLTGETSIPATAALSGKRAEAGTASGGRHTRGALALVAAAVAALLVFYFYALGVRQ